MITAVEREVVATAQRFKSLAETSVNPEDAVDQVRERMHTSAEETIRRAAGLDVIRVVASVRVAMAMDSAVHGVEPSAACLEVLALIMAYRDAGQVPNLDVVAKRSYLPTNVQAAAQDVLDNGMLLTIFATPPTDADAQVVMRSVQREISLRNPVYPHMLLDTLRLLFDDPSVEEDCQAVLGFSGVQAVEVMESVRTLSMTALGERFDAMVQARDASLPHLQAWQQRRSSPAGDDGVPAARERAAAEAVIGAIHDLTTNVDQAVLIDPDEAAKATGYERSVVDAVLNAFTFTVGDRGLDGALERFFRGDNPLRTAPIVTDGQERRFLVHDALALPSVREVIETKLKAAGKVERYQGHRGKVVESLALDLLATALPGATVYRAFKYFVPDPDAAVPQTAPETFTKRTESDGLILIDDIAIIVEVKAVALTAEARGGVARRLRGKLRDIVTNAAKQADRLRERIVTDGRIRIADDDWIDARGVREIHTIAVGLEDLSGVTTATAQLVAAGILEADHIPWTVSIHDLRIICELIDRPTDLLLYLRRRTHRDATRKFLAVDELDLYLLYLTRGLYVVPDPDAPTSTSRIATIPSVADRRRYRDQHAEIVESRTEQLDDWYESQRDADAPRATKPTVTTHKQLLPLVDALIAAAAPGWLSTATAMLEGSARAQAEFGRHAQVLAAHVADDRKQHSLTTIVPDTMGNQSLLVFACCGRDETPDQAVEYLAAYLAAKKYQTGFSRAALLLFDANGRALQRLIFNNTKHVYDAALEADAARLIPLDQMAARSTKAHKPKNFKRR